MTFWEKLLKLIGLYKEPSRPPRRRPASAKANERNSKGDAGNAPAKNRKKPVKGGNRVESRKPGSKTGDFPVESSRLYIGNLSYDATEHDLEELFKGVGSVRNIEIIYNRHTHRSRGYGFIEMLNLDEAKRAVEILHDQPFMGRNMIVNGASSKPAQQKEQSGEDSPTGEEAERESAAQASAQ